jgi:hypothetical protein
MVPEFPAVWAFDAGAVLHVLKSRAEIPKSVLANLMTSLPI